MKTYIIKPDSIDMFGSEANSMTVLSDSDVSDLASEWEMDRDELLSHLIEQRPTCRTPIHRFSGNYMSDWNALNGLIEFDSGNPEPFFQTEDDFISSLKENFVTFDGYYTTIWED